MAENRVDQLRPKDFTLRDWAIVVGALVFVGGGIYWLGGFVREMRLNAELPNRIGAEIFGAMHTQRFFPDDERLVVRAVDEGSVVFLRLDHAPVPNSLRIQFAQLLAPLDYFAVENNILMLATTESAGEQRRGIVRSEGLAVTYLADPTPGREPFTLIERDGRLFGNDTLLMGPNGVRWPNGANPFGPFNEYRSRRDNDRE